MFNSKMLNYLFYVVNWKKPRQSADTILTAHYKQINCNLKISAEELLKTLTNESYFSLFVDSMNKLKYHFLYDSRIHGQSHIERVAILSFALGLQLQLEYEDLRLCLEIAKYHDVGRQDEGEDELHGIRGAEKIAVICDDLSNEDKTLIAAVIAAHSFEDDCCMDVFEQRDVSTDDHYLKHKLLLGIIKDADALDRFRLRNNSLNTDYLRLTNSIALIRAACEMVHA